MSYVRGGPDSDVYVFHNVYGGIECCGCWLTGEMKFPSFGTRWGIIHHLEEHRAKGDKVPERAFERLSRELQELGDVVDPDGPPQERPE